eukprot:3872728-Rhodomonas_salina.1
MSGQGTKLLTAGGSWKSVAKCPSRSLKSFISHLNSTLWPLNTTPTPKRVGRVPRKGHRVPKEGLAGRFC